MSYLRVLQIYYVSVFIVVGFLEILIVALIVYLHRRKLRQMRMWTL